MHFNSITHGMLSFNMTQCACMHVYNFGLIVIQTVSRILFFLYSPSRSFSIRLNYLGTDQNPIIFSKMPGILFFSFHIHLSFSFYFSRLDIFIQVVFQPSRLSRLDRISAVQTIPSGSNISRLDNPVQIVLLSSGHLVSDQDSTISHQDSNLSMYFHPIQTFNSVGRFHTILSFIFSCYEMQFKNNYTNIMTCQIRSDSFYLQIPLLSKPRASELNPLDLHLFKL